MAAATPASISSMAMTWAAWVRKQTATSMPSTSIAWSISWGLVPSRVVSPAAFVEARPVSAPRSFARSPRIWSVRLRSGRSEYAGRAFPMEVHPPPRLESTALLILGAWSR